MENLRIIEVKNAIDDSITEHIIIDREDGSQLSMLKSTWEELQAKQTEGGLI